MSNREEMIADAMAFYKGLEGRGYAPRVDITRDDVDPTVLHVEMEALAPVPEVVLCVDLTLPSTDNPLSSAD